MSGITLSASVRQNLLSLQSTADLLATTQSRLSSGNKVNSALDNPTNFFTAQKLNSRSSDINNLLDGISNGVQIIQAANTGITSLQKLVDSAKSIANQALQTTVGYTKSNATSAASKGITANDLLGTTAAVVSSVTGDQLANNVSATFANSIVAGASALTSDQTTLVSDATTTSTAALQVPGPLVNVDTTFTGGAIQDAATGTVTGTTTLTSGGTAAGTIDLSALDNKSITLNGVTISFDSTPTTAGITGSNATGYTVDISSGSTVTMTQLLATFDAATGNTDPATKSVINNSKIELHTGAGATASIDFAGSTAANLGVLGIAALDDSGSTTHDPLTGALAATTTAGPTVAATGTSLLSDVGLTAGQSLIINGKSITFSATASTAPSATGSNINLTTGTVNDLLAAINGVFGSATGHGTASLGTGLDAGKIVLDGGAANATMTVAENTTTTGALAKLGLSTNSYSRVTTPKLPPAAITGATKLAGDASPVSNSLSSNFAAGDAFTVNGKTIQFFDSRLATGATGSAAGGDPAIKYLDVATSSVDDVLGAIDTITGVKTGASTDVLSSVSTATDTAGKINLNTGTKQDLVLGEVGTGSVLSKLGLTAGTTKRLSTPVTAPAITGTTALSGAVGENSLTTSFAAGDKITVNGTDITFVASGATGNDVNITDDIDTLLAKIDTITGGSGSKVVNGKVQLNAGDAADVVLSDNGTTATTGGKAGDILAKLGLKPGTTAKSTPIDPGLTGKTLTIGAVGDSKVPLTITFGADDSTGQVSTLDELNKALAANNLQASISTTGAITLVTTNDAASSDIGALGGTATDPGGIFSGVTVNASVKDPNSQATRASLVSQYNQVIDQIKTTAQDSSYNGVNLLNGDTLSLTFNETGSSKLNISGVNFGPEGLGLSSLLSGNDFIDNASTNKILASLNDASTALRSQASSFGSNLSVVQIRQDFAKNLINVLQTGASNLTLADTNEEAANSQALSTRQSIAVSALSLANQSQQGVLQLLR